MPFPKHPDCGTTAVHYQDNEWYCTKCRKTFRVGPSEKEIADESVKGWADWSKIPNPTWPKQPRSSKHLPSNPRDIP
jgi:hypothetical protein